MQKRDNVLIDTCVLMSNLDIIEKINAKGGNVFVTNTILDELDYNKKGDNDVNKNSRDFLRELNKQGINRSSGVLFNIVALGTDVVSHSKYKNINISIIHRPQFHSTGNNDSKIIEIAMDYSFILISADQGMVVRAQTAGLNAYYWAGVEIEHYSISSNNIKRRNSIIPFSLCKEPSIQQEKILHVSELPSIGDSVLSSNGEQYKLEEILGKGGEGNIFLTNNQNIVCKIYKKEKLTNLKCNKIKLMITRKINRKGIAWPIDFVTNINGEFVGYLMPKAKGVPLQPTIFVKPYFEKIFPAWTREDLAIVCLKFLKYMSLLHDANILVGDINPLNLLINSDSSDVWLVDTDSFQIENYPCPVGTVNFTAPEIQGKNYSSFLRTKEHELFAVATMLFMILLPGKPPYSQQGGGSPGENIKNRIFPYPFHNNEQNIEHKSINLPEGPYRYMWSHLSFKLKEAFNETFRENKPISLDRWTNILNNYQSNIKKHYLSDELFPKQNKITDGEKVHCSRCNASFDIQKDFLKDLQAQSRDLICPTCLRKIKLQRLAAKAQKNNKNPSKKAKNLWGWTKGNPAINSNLSSPSSHASAKGKSKPKHTQQSQSPAQSTNCNSGLGGCMWGMVVLVILGFILVSIGMKNAGIVAGVVILLFLIGRKIE